MNEGRVPARRIVCHALGVLALVLSQAAGATQIENRATMTYDGHQDPVASNTVVTQVVAAAPQARIGIYVAGTGSKAMTVQVGKDCGSAMTGDVSVVPAYAAAPGNSLVVVVDDASANLDPQARDTIKATVAAGGASVALSLLETGVNTGQFASAVKTAAAADGTPDACTLPVGGDGELSARYAGTSVALADSVASISVSRFGVVFDAASGKPVNGARVTILDAGTGAPATAHGIDGSAAYPSTVISGQASGDAAGRAYPVPDGGYIFPILKPGTYRIVVQPPGQQRFPSAAAAGDFGAGFPQVSGKVVHVTTASFGQAFAVAVPSSTPADIPLDNNTSGLVVTKTVSSPTAAPGDYLQYRISVANTSGTDTAVSPQLIDRMPEGFRYKAGSFRLATAVGPDPAISQDGRTLTAQLPPLKPGASYSLSYVASVGANTPVGAAVNSAQVRTGGVSSAAAQAAVQVEGGLFSDAITIIGRVVSDACATDSPAARPVAGVRILLEDGTFVVTDRNGQFHIENVRPGVHVAQVDRNSIPDGYRLARCADQTRRARSDLSQFIDARGGALWRADFYLARDPKAVRAPEPRPATADPASDVQAAGGRSDWIGQGTGRPAILFPGQDYNPRSPTTRLVVAHAVGDGVRITIEGRVPDPILRDSDVTNATKTAAVSIWSGLPLAAGNNHIVVEIVRNGGTVETLRRTVAYVNKADHAEFSPRQSILVADGRTDPVIAVRVLDRDGHPVRAGVGGRLDVSAPYRTADAVEKRRQSQLVTDLSATTMWRVDGDDGIAYVRLAPTTQTGEVRLDLHLADTPVGPGQRQSGTSVIDRRDQVTAWLSPGQQDWVVVGFAAGSAGYRTITNEAETLGSAAADTSTLNGQIKLYAKGRIKGRWLLTLAYDSAKQGDVQRRQSLLTTVDPDAYYTLYGDRAQQSYDAQSTKNVFVKFEARQFYALFGDFASGFDETELGRYDRILTGLKAEYRSQKTAFTAFAARTPFRNQHDEIEGNGLTGPYPLSRQNIVLNTETIEVQTRDRLRPGLILSRTALARFVDYDVDYLRGTLTLRTPLASRDYRLDPQVLVVNFETYGTASERTVAGVRGKQRIGKSLVVGATGIQNDDDARTRMGTLDATMQIAPGLIAHIEAGGTFADGHASDHAYVAEVEKRLPSLQLRAFVQEQTAGFGVGQTTAVEAGFRKAGIDVAERIGQQSTLTASAYRIDDLRSPASQEQLRLDARIRLDPHTDLTLTGQGTRGTDATGLTTTTGQVGGNITRSSLDNRLKTSLDVATTVSGNPTVSTPSRYALGATYAITHNVRAVATEELAKGGGVTALNTSGGLQVTPWVGGTVTTSLNRQSLAQESDRTFGALGMHQNLRIASHWLADLSVDSSHSFAGHAALGTVNPLYPPVVGGTVDRTRLNDDYTALSAGIGYRMGAWSWTGRIEARLGSDRRYGASTSLIKQLSDGRALGGSAAFYRLDQATGSVVGHADGALSVALRAPGSRLHLLDKLNLIYDSATGVSNYVVPIGSGSTVKDVFGNDGPVQSANNISAMRFINNFVVNWSPASTASRESRTQVSLYYGAKYSIQNFDGVNYGGLTDMASLEIRQDIVRWLDIGIQAGFRHVWASGTAQWSAGPTIGTAPVKGAWISIGYNVTGFRDRDFTGANATVKGPWMAIRFKFDEQTLGLVKERRR